MVCRSLSDDATKIVARKSVLSMHSVRMNYPKW